MFQIPLKPRAILIDVVPPYVGTAAAERRLLELESLVATYGGMVIVKLIQKKSLPDYKTYIGSGKVEEIVRIAGDENADVLIVNNLLKPKQMFNVGEALRRAKLRMQVWDRVDVILKIFAKHASTSEAKLQIKLAAIRHMGPRIFGMGMELMQQAGGTGTRGGQGETNTELMKRHLFDQEQRTKKELERLAVARQNHRTRRDRLGLKTVSVVGYTNAGKSSLVNALTNKGALVADALFATLDTRVGKLWINGRDVLVSDTIGFIQDLPPELIDAFRSTLDETVDADLLLHVIDVGDEYLADKVMEVEDVLAKLNVERTPKLYVFNKIDLLESQDAKREAQEALAKRYAAYSPSFVSSVTGEGLEELKARIAQAVGASAVS